MFSALNEKEILKKPSVNQYEYKIEIMRIIYVRKHE